MNPDKDGKPGRWKIENSWGDEPSRKGYFVASDAWFDESVYQAVVNRRFLNEEQCKAPDTAPLSWPLGIPWDL